MPSTYTDSGIELIAPGEQSGTWNVTTNLNLQIIDRMTSQAGTISLSGTTHTLTVSDGVLSDGQYGVLVFQGSPSGTNTVTISPNTAKRVFIVRNTTAQSVVLTQGSGGNVTVPAGATKIVSSDGDGLTATVTDVTSTFAANIQGNVTGNLTGTVTGNASTATALQTARTIGGVSFDGTANINLPGVNQAGNQNTTGNAATATALQTARNINGVSFNGTADITIPTVPSGGIIMWSGAIANIPSGWFLCDGANGTPDLRNRFVVGAGSTYTPGNTGGADTVTLTTAQIPSHTHTFSGTTNTAGNHNHEYYSSGVSGSNPWPDVDSSSGAAPTAHPTSFAGDHSHTFSGTTAATGGGGSHENRPPYYALAYIMKS
jgi:microcystin-dependent protein